MYKKILILGVLISTTVTWTFSSSVEHVNIGGYGELHYNLAFSESSRLQSTLDFHRFVLFLGYNFSENWSFQSELELEHNIVDEGKGALELEQAFIQYIYSPALIFQVGVILPRVGLYNLTHEPPTFLSVERPDYTHDILPLTWFGNGLSIYGILGGFEYSLVILEGLDGSGVSITQGIRDARGEGFKGFSKNGYKFLYNAALDFTGVTGLKFGLSASYNNSYVTNNLGNDINFPVYITESHLQYKSHGIWTALEIGYIYYGNQAVIDLQSSFGYYIELGYDLGFLFGWDASLIPFLRWEETDTAWKSWSGANYGQNSRRWMAGISFLPIHQISIKLDYSQKTHDSFSQNSTHFLNLGFGYQI